MQRVLAWPDAMEVLRRLDIHSFFVAEKAAKSLYHEIDYYHHHGYTHKSSTRDINSTSLSTNIALVMGSEATGVTYLLITSTDNESSTCTLI